MSNTPIHPGVRIGHVHLKVADLERALGFYRDVLGFELMQRLGTQAAFLSAGGYHHHIPVKPKRPLQVRHLQMHMADADGGMDGCVAHVNFVQAKADSKNDPSYAICSNRVSQAPKCGHSSRMRASPTSKAARVPRKGFW